MGLNSLNSLVYDTLHDAVKEFGLCVCVCVCVSCTDFTVVKIIFAQSVNDTSQAK